MSGVELSRECPWRKFPGNVCGENFQEGNFFTGLNFSRGNILGVNYLDTLARNKTMCFTVVNTHTHRQMYFDCLCMISSVLAELKIVA